MAYYSPTITWRHILLLCLTLALLQAGSALAAVSITVLPLDPSPTDSVILTVFDSTHPNNCVPVSLEAAVTGNNIQLTGILVDTGQITFCLNTITPYSVMIELGPLTTGEYMVDFRIAEETAVAATANFQVTATPPPSGPISTSVWMDGTQPGQGFFVWIQDEQLVATWYIYDEQGQDTWVRIKSPLSSINNLPLTQPLLARESTMVGSAAVTLPAANRAQFDYNFNAAQGSLLLSPSPMECAGANNPMYPQAWTDPLQPETRVHLLQQGDCLFGAWSFVDGERFRWLIFSGTLTASGTLNTVLTGLTGPPLGTPWDTSLLVEQNLGVVGITIDQQTLTFRPTLDGEPALQLIMEPFVL